MVLIIIGCLLLLLVPVGLAVHHSVLRDVWAVRRSRQVTTRELRQPGPNLVAFTGRAENEILQSHLSQTRCVWFQYQVIEHFDQLRTSAVGSRWHPKTKVIVENSAPPSITLRDEHGVVSCDLRVTDSDQPAGLDEVFQRKTDPTLFGIQVPSANHDGKSSRFTGYELREWVVRPGQQLHVIGEASRRATSEPTIVPPRDGGRFLVSAQSGHRVAEQAEKSRRANLGCLLFAGGTGIILIVLGLVLN